MSSQPSWVPPHWQPPATTEPVGRRWLLLVVPGATAIVVATVFAILAVSGQLKEPVLAGAGTVSEHAHSGTYYLYAQTGTSNSFGPVHFFTSYPADVTAGAVHINLDAQPLTVSPYAHGYSSTLELGHRSFSAVAQVQVTHSGTLTLTADRDVGALVVAPTIGETARAFIVPGIVGFCGLVAAVIGVISRIRAGGRRRPRWVQGHWQPPSGPATPL